MLMYTYTYMNVYMCVCVYIYIYMCGNTAYRAIEPLRITAREIPSPRQPYAHTQVSTLPLVFVNIKPQNDYLNMTSACLCVNV